MSKSNVSAFLVALIWFVWLVVSLTQSGEQPRPEEMTNLNDVLRYNIW